MKKGFELSTQTGPQPATNVGGSSPAAQAFRAICTRRTAAVVWHARCFALAQDPNFDWRNHKMAKDPVCGMSVDEATAIKAERDGKTYYFCCESCRQKFMSGSASPKE